MEKRVQPLPTARQLTARQPNPTWARGPTAPKLPRTAPEKCWQTGTPARHAPQPKRHSGAPHATIHPQ